MEIDRLTSGITSGVTLGEFPFGGMIHFWYNNIPVSLLTMDRLKTSSKCLFILYNFLEGRRRETGTLFTFLLRDGLISDWNA